MSTNYIYVHCTYSYILILYELLLISDGLKFKVVKMVKLEAYKTCVIGWAMPWTPVPLSEDEVSFYSKELNLTPNQIAEFKQAPRRVRMRFTWISGSHVSGSLKKKKNTRRGL